MEWSERKQQLRVYCGPRHEEVACPRCGCLSRHPHQYDERTVRDMPAWGKRCYLRFRARRFKCEQCGRPFTETLPSVNTKAGVTWRYERYVFGLCRRTSIKAIAQHERLGYKAVEAIYYRQATGEVTLGDDEVVKRLGMDEIALRKGHDQYNLVLIDLDLGRVLTLLPDRKKETLEAYLDTWSEEQRAGVKEVAIDMWEPYFLAAQAKLPNAMVTADRFHVMKNLNEHVSEARREIQRSAPVEEKEKLKGIRWLLVRNEADLTEEEKVRLGQACEASPLLLKLHECREGFREIFESPLDLDAAAARLDGWIASVQAAGIKALETFVRTLRNWWQPILNYFRERTNSGPVEGTNNKIKLIKRVGYGYTNFRHFRTRVVTECDGRA